MIFHFSEVLAFITATVACLLRYYGLPIEYSIFTAVLAIAIYLLTVILVNRQSPPLAAQAIYRNNLGIILIGSGLMLFKPLSAGFSMLFILISVSITIRIFKNEDHHPDPRKKNPYFPINIF